MVPAYWLIEASKLEFTNRILTTLIHECCTIAGLHLHLSDAWCTSAMAQHPQNGKEYRLRLHVLLTSVHQSLASPLLQMPHLLQSIFVLYSQSTPTVRARISMKSQFRCSLYSWRSRQKCSLWGIIALFRIDTASTTSS